MLDAKREGVANIGNVQKARNNLKRKSKLQKGN